ncbi:hypothetical protein ABZ946_33405 [Streptomyces sp. NPDC046324]|uniref:hypothetical protein n=1 Tax=Streptomyces sp. NPDC046324 TaxID=3154915 RepID=UPI0033ED3204
MMNNPRKGAPPQRGPRISDLSSRLLPKCDRERWAEEWAAECQDKGNEDFTVRWGFRARLLIRTAPALAWTLRLHKRRETA